MAEETVYCLCRQPYDETRFMIECDVCKDWFHGSCVGIQEHQASDIEIYHCPSCQVRHGPLVVKKRKNWHRHDYSENVDQDDDNGMFDKIDFVDPQEILHEKKEVQTGTVVFIKELKNRTFPSGDEIPMLRLHGSQLTTEFIEKNGFNLPIMVEKKDGLGMSVPPSSFSIQDVENYVGSMKEIDVIDVSRQEEYKMLMREWTDYYNSPNRNKIFNVISLEFSQTRLSEFVEVPMIVRRLSWVHNLWPEQLPEECHFTKTEVQKYCLMGVKDSFTDFHIDFGGTSVWYHVLRGEKIFYLIQPTPANLTLYQQWCNSYNQSETFFGDQVDKCYRIVAKQGQTIFLPTGWIHAVFTPIDSLVFGGNFLHSYNIGLQLAVYEIERTIKTAEKYLFPNFETVNWYAAKHILEILKEHVEENVWSPAYLVHGAKALTNHLKVWLQRKDYVKSQRSHCPEPLMYSRILKELTKTVKNINVKVPTPQKETRGRKQQKENQPLDYESDQSPPRPPVSPRKRKKANESPLKKNDNDQKVSPPKKSSLDTLDDIFDSVMARTSSPGLSFDSDPNDDLIDYELVEEPSPKSRRKRKKAEPDQKNVYEFDADHQSLLRSPVRRGRSGRTESETDNTLPQANTRSQSKSAQKSFKVKIEKGPSGFKVDKGGTGKGPAKSGGKKTRKGSSATFQEDKDGPKVKVEKIEREFTFEFHDEEELVTDNQRSVGKKSKAATKAPKGRQKKTKVTEERQGAEGKGSLKMRLPKPGLYVNEESAEQKETSAATPSAIKLKVSNGKIVSGGQTKSPSPGKFHPFDFKDDSDSDEDQLVVDETPKKRAPPPSKPMTPFQQAHEARTGGLKLKLTIPPRTAASRSKTESSSSQDITSQESQDSSIDASLSEPELDEDGIPKSRLDMPEIRGGLNGSIADILEASGYGTETDFKIDENLGSPSMRDAIGGLLSMRLGGFQQVKGRSGSPLADLARPKGTIKLQRMRKTMLSDDTGEKMQTCFKDEEYVYPTLDISDDEGEHVFKPRGRQRKDETWNPKAKLEPNCPKPEREPREGTKKEAVESGLAAAAAALADKPAPKRQYIRKKPKLEKPSQLLVAIPSSPFDFEPQPGTSASSISLSGSASSDIMSAGLDSSLNNPKTPTSPAKAACKKPRKGMATAKQRLGKILKIHKMMH
ncbi:histone lysine demethylase PHF8-like isoform X2 [Lineus longissimus]|uniref:histone lysine demethylase PHF8-like isoform X2 n=1 Tax=Lineus longissimus TaxID=88925 RepID=UPI00315D4723